MRPVLLFGLGDTLVQYYRREEFPLLQAGIQAAKEALDHSGHDLPSDSEIERRVQLRITKPKTVAFAHSTRGLVVFLW